jgi:hypothetical protein
LVIGSCGILVVVTSRILVVGASKIGDGDEKNIDCGGRQN